MRIFHPTPLAVAIALSIAALTSAGHALLEQRMGAETCSTAPAAGADACADRPGELVASEIKA